MAVRAITGVNWGDEGKGRMVDYFAQNADMVIRYQGGNNAGHTVINNYGKFALHHIPSGIFNKNAKNIIAHGSVVNLEALCHEVTEIENALGSVELDNLFISEKCHIIFPYHILLDQYEEERLKDKKFGSTKRGIAPVYSDKYLKIGIHMSSIFNKDYLINRIKHVLEVKNQVFEHIYKKPHIQADEMMDWVLHWGEKVKDKITNTITMVQDAVKNDNDVLLEGQLGALRDIEAGIYPYTTSSSPLPGYASVGACIPPKYIANIIGVMKSYSTCVGEGPFVTELFDDTAEYIRKKGKEFGASTGRPRRIGWLDLVASRYGCLCSGVDEITLTMLDVLNDIEKIKVCTAYSVNKSQTTDFPDMPLLNEAKPVYETLEGWENDISGMRNYNELPDNVKIYIDYIESYLKIPIKYISVGPEREQLIIR